MYSQILVFVLATFLLLSGSRVALMAWQYRRVQQAQGGLPILIGGLRIDAHLVALGVLPPLLVAPWFADVPVAITMTGVWLQCAWLLVCLLELSTPLFITEYDVRPNRLYVDYLKHPREVLGMIGKGYRAAALLTVALLCVLAMAGHAMFAEPTAVSRPHHLVGQLGLCLAGGLLAFLAIRGTLRHRPINPSTVAFCGDPLLNALALNSLYSVFYAIYCRKNERSAFDAYGSLPPAQIIATVRRCAGLPPEPTRTALPTLHRHAPATPSVRTPPRHVVIIVEESLGATFTGHLGGLPLTPNLDALSQLGWSFRRAYATGTRSVRGLEALVAGFPPSLSDAVLRLPDAQSGFFTLAQLLQQQGYRSRFIYGGEAHFDNMKSFFLGNGFDELHDRPTFKNPAFVGTWGVSDEDMFDRLHELLSADEAQPTFTVAFSVSNHSPWEHPAGRIDPVGPAATVENSVRYADWALGRFFTQARRSPYWNDTVFLVAADHDARVGGQHRVPVRHFHIPALLLGGGVEPRVDHRVVSQIDFPVTLLALLGLTTEHPMIGHDLTDPNAGGRAFMQYGDNFGYLKADRLAVLEPRLPVTQWQYGMPDTYAAQSVDPAFAQEALAHALWPDMAYRGGQYALADLPPAPTANAPALAVA